MFLDEQGRVVKAMFNKQAIDNEEMKKPAGFRHLQSINCQHNFGMDKGGPGAPRQAEERKLSGFRIPEGSRLSATARRIFFRAQPKQFTLHL